MLNNSIDIERSAQVLFSTSGPQYDRNEHNLVSSPIKNVEWWNEERGMVERGTWNGGTRNVECCDGIGAFYFYGPVALSHTLPSGVAPKNEILSAAANPDSWTWRCGYRLQYSAFAFASWLLPSSWSSHVSHPRLVQRSSRVQARDVARSNIA